MTDGIVQQFNARWSERRVRFAATCPPPWWAPGLILTPELRARYEAWLPVDAFAADLRRLLRHLLPGPEWVPSCLQPRAGGGTAFASVPDLWAALPTSLAGRVCFAEDEILPLACALASPPRFGTGCGRYPGQVRDLVSCLNPGSAQGLRLLDLGCGTGQGTVEAVLELQALTGLPCVGVGVTREPLEAWMAAERRLPHLSEHERRYRELPECRVVFLAADARRPPLNARFDVILCNGLVGGPALSEAEDVVQLLGRMDCLLAPGGGCTWANRFHGGHRPKVRRALDLARERGWAVQGSEELALLRRVSSTPRNRARPGV